MMMNKMGLYTRKEMARGNAMIIGATSGDDGGQKGEENMLRRLAGGAQWLSKSKPSNHNETTGTVPDRFRHWLR